MPRGAYNAPYGLGATPNCALDEAESDSESDESAEHDQHHGDVSSKDGRNRCSRRRNTRRNGSFHMSRNVTSKAPNTVLWRLRLSVCRQLSQNYRNKMPELALRPYRCSNDHHNKYRKGYKDVYNWRSHHEADRVIVNGRKHCA